MLEAGMAPRAGAGVCPCPAQTAPGPLLYSQQPEYVRAHACCLEHCTPLTGAQKQNPGGALSLILLSS